MDDDSDFTFCQVASLNGAVDFKEKTLVSDIGDIKIDDGSMNSSRGFIWKDKAQENPTSTKQATIGSLSFNVTDMSVPIQVSNFPKENTAGNVGTSVKNGKELKKRTKVPFEKGHSQMDWLKLTRTHPDLAGLQGGSNRRLISMSEVKTHQTEGSMWTVLKGCVYNLSPYMKFHPGGADVLMKAVGKDCTSLFNKYHAWVNADFLMEKCLVGILEESQ